MTERGENAKGSTPGAGPNAASNDIYERLELRPIVNAWGTVTRIGGSTLAPEVAEAMHLASTAYVNVEEMLRRAGDHIARLIGVEATFISSGAAAGLCISTAACMAGSDPVRIAQLPDSDGMPNEVIVLKSQRFRYDQAIRMAGARLVEVGLADLTFREQVEAAVTERTAAFHYLAESESIRGAIPLEEVIEIMRPRGIPVIVDAAAELPPLRNLTHYIELGADLVLFSGGKDIRGPQSSGLVLGRADLIEACLLNSNPFHSVGRPMKVDKETIAGLTRAVELYVEKDFEEEAARWERIVANLLEGCKQIPGTTATRGFPSEPGIQPRTIPRVFLRMHEAARLSPKDVRDRLWEGEPCIAVGLLGDALVLNPQTLDEAQCELISERLHRIMDEAR